MKTSMSHHRRIVALALILPLECAASTALAQLDSPPPELQGQKSKHLWTVAGVINNVGLGTVFSCTNTSSTDVIVGVEVFDKVGNSVNDPSLKSATILPSGTRQFGTTSMAGLLIGINDLQIPTVDYGSARILATDKNVVCSAFLADPSAIPVTSMTSLTIVKKTKQKGD